MSEQTPIDPTKCHIAETEKLLSVVESGNIFGLIDIDYQKIGEELKAVSPADSLRLTIDIGKAAIDILGRFQECAKAYKLFLK